MRTKADLREAILTAKQATGLTWEEVGEALERSPVGAATPHHPAANPDDDASVKQHRIARPVRASGTGRARRGRGTGVR